LLIEPKFNQQSEISNQQSGNLALTRLLLWTRSTSRRENAVRTHHAAPDRCNCIKTKTHVFQLEREVWLAQSLLFRWRRVIVRVTTSN